MRPRPRLRLESRHQPLLPWSEFLKRVGRYFAASSLLVGVSLFAGMAGYHWFENLEWIDAFVNAAMILSGMGPLATPQTFGGKLFAGLYALYSGLALLVATGILFTPIAHRLFHQFHLETEGAK